jgi:flagellar hook-associated protein 1
MSSLFSTLRVSAGTLQSFERALEITQNNIGNASTPDYAAQQVQFDSFAFQPETGLGGGNVTATAKSTRDAFADSSVRQELSNLGATDSQVSALTSLQGNFDVTGQTGVSGSLSSFFNAFSALCANPQDANALQSVIDGAQKVAESFRQTAGSLASSAASLDQQIQGNINSINSLASQIQGFNQQRGRELGPDANLDAKVQNALENLSQIANVTSTVNPDGTTSILLGGQTPLVLGTQTYQLRSGLAPVSVPAPSNPAGLPGVQIQDANGNDITFQVTNGSLGGLLQVRNTSLAALQGDTNQPGSLNQLAQAFADRVNNLLASGQISSGPPPTPGIPLFTYDATDATKTAGTLAINPAIDSGTIATIDPGPPVVSNGIASRIAALAQGTNAADQISGLSFTAYFGQIAASVGSQLAHATDQQTLFSQSVTQVTNFRNQISGVSLDTEAVNLIQFQKSYAATAKLITVLNEVTQTTIDMLQ